LRKESISKKLAAGVFYIEIPCGLGNPHGILRYCFNLMCFDL